MLFVFIFVAVLFSTSCALIVRDYNRVNFQEFDSYADFARVFLTFHGGHSNTNLLVGVTTPECKDVLLSPAFRGAQRHAGGGVINVVTLPLVGFPLDLNDACAEVFFYSFNSSMTNPQSRTTKLEYEDFTPWASEVIRTDLLVKNGFDFPIMYYWHDESKEKLEQNVLEVGERAKISSFLGHVFSASPAEEGRENELLDFMVVNGQDYTFQPSNRLETCEIVPGSESSFVSGDILSCDDMDMRFVEFTHNVWYQKRLGLNYVQPQMVRPVTAEGFKNIRLPSHTFAWLKQWFHESQKKIEQEESTVGPCMNQVTIKL